jgi:UDP-glucose 4-epimerase
MKILVTGGVGFIGSNLILRLIRDGHIVHSLDNYSTGSVHNEFYGCKYIH